MILKFCTRIAILLFIFEKPLYACEWKVEFLQGTVGHHLLPNGAITRISPGTKPQITEFVNSKGEIDTKCEVSALKKSSRNQVEIRESFEILCFHAFGGEFDKESSLLLRAVRIYNDKLGYSKSYIPIQSSILRRDSDNKQHAGKNRTINDILIKAHCEPAPD